MIEKKRYSIGEVSKLTGITISALRYYDKEGVLVPEIRDDGNGYRYYSPEQLATAQIIRDCKSLGIHLKDIKDVLAQRSTDCIKNCISTQIQELEAEIELFNQRLDSIRYAYQRLTSAERIYNIYSDGYSPNEAIRYPVSVSVTKQAWVLSTRRHMALDAGKQFHDRCLELQELRERYHLFPAGAYIGIFHDGYEKQFHQEVGDLEVCLPIIKSPDFHCEELRQLEEVRVVDTIHLGDYAEMDSTYAYLVDWISTNGYRVAGPAREYYLLDASNAFDISKYITRICLPVEKQPVAQRD